MRRARVRAQLAAARVESSAFCTVRGVQTQVYMESHAGVDMDSVGMCNVGMRNVGVRGAGGVCKDTDGIRSIGMNDLGVDSVGTRSICSIGFGSTSMDVGGPREGLRACLRALFVFFALYNEIAQEAYSCIDEIGAASDLDWRMFGQVAHQHQASIRAYAEGMAFVQ